MTRNIICHLLLTFWFSAAGFAADSAETTRDSLLAGVRAWVAGQSGVAAERVEIPPLDGRMKVSACPSGARFDFPFPGRNLVRARCESPAWQVFIQVNVRAERKIYVAGRDLPAGQVIGEADLALRASALSAAAGEIEDRSLVLGRVLKRPLVAGAALLTRDMDDAVRVLRLTGPVKSGAALTPENYRLETVSRAQLPPGAAAGNAPAVGARVVRDLPEGHIVRADELSEFRQALVARLNLVAGQPVEASMFVMGLVSAKDTSQRYYMDLGGLEFSELARNLQAGEPLRPPDVRPAILVRRGQTVILTVNTAGGLQITLRSEALQDGRLGDSVKLKNPESGREMSGIVTGRNTARTI